MYVRACVGCNIFQTADWTDFCSSQSGSGIDSTTHTERLNLIRTIASNFVMTD